MDSSSIYEHPAHKPEHNFPGRNTKQNYETIFAKQFAQSYQRKFIDIHSRTTKKHTLFIREVPIPGNGIPDLLVFNWNQEIESDPVLALTSRKLIPTIRAFEIKISDWRKGLMQAHRYSYFSNASFLVLPWNKRNLIELHLDIFRSLRIGLWLFDTENDRIMNLYSPRPKQPRLKKYTQKAIDLAVEAISS